MSFESFMCGSPVARGAAGVALDPILLHEHWTLHRLRYGRAVVHGEDFAARPHVLLGVAVAVEAPLHLKGLHLPHERHLIDAPVAGLASHTLLHVDAVV